ncbi:MAG: hypothetical protein R3286_14500 [Gammaproteobacteria bacterium]|nr:hypothetical protein [Gammaproteobacteria bacterium]
MAAVAVPAQAAHVRVTCRGIQEYSRFERALSCDESNVLTDQDGRLVFGHTSAQADLARGTLAASASGGSVRDVGYNGGEATALFKDEFAVEGAWQGEVPVTVSMWITYRFAGSGESRIHASLGATASSGLIADDRAQIRLHHRGFNKATLQNVINDGGYRTPQNGSYPAQSTLVMSITEMVAFDSPRLIVRARVDSYALPNLDTINPSAASLVDVRARISVSLPEHLHLRSESESHPSGPH